MTLIDADKLKQHYALLDNEEKELFDQIVNAQPTIHIDQLVYEQAAELVNDLIVACSMCGLNIRDEFINTPADISAINYLIERWNKRESDERDKKEKHNE